MHNHNGEREGSPLLYGAPCHGMAPGPDISLHGGENFAALRALEDTNE